MTEKIDIEKAEKLLEGVSPLPWRIGKLDGWASCHEAWASRVRTLVAGPENSKNTINVAESGIDGGLRNTNPEHDFELIAFAVNNFQAMIEEIKILRASQSQEITKPMRGCTTPLIHYDPVG